MAINWDKLHRNIDTIIDDSEGRTDARLASQISSVTRLTDDEVRKLFPDPADVKTLAELMEIVKRNTARNKKINNISENIDKFGGVVLTLLGKFV